MIDLVRVCPKCKSERQTSEMRCGYVAESGEVCQWPLAGIPPVPSGSSQPVPEAPLATPASPSAERHCENGHVVPAGEFMCSECGADVKEPDTPEVIDVGSTSDPLIGECIEGWSIKESIDSAGKSRNCYRVENASGEPGYLVLYHEQHEPDTSIYDVLRNTDHDHVPDIILTGRWNQRSYEVVEWIEGGSLAEHSYFSLDDLASFQRIADELGRALHDLAEMGVRHRNICPRSILIRTENPLDLVIIDFSSARLSDFDLDTVAPLDISRYSAPEAIVGGVSTASDWWGLGMLLLEQVTAGKCFEGINDRAFTIHVITRGIEVPESIPVPLRSLLQGLLARDPLQRWQWEQVNRWLKGEPVDLPLEFKSADYKGASEQITVNGNAYSDPEQLALALATDEHWESGLECFESGRLSTWLQSNYAETLMPGRVRALSAATNIPIEWKYSLALMELNPALPLCTSGLLVTPTWLLDNPIEAFSLVTGAVPGYLESIEREPWIVNLYYRYQKVLDRAKLLEIEIDDDRLKITSLATSRANLEAERNRLRELYPVSTHDSLSNLMEKTRLNEEDLVLLLCANSSQFKPFDMVVDECIELSDKYDLRDFNRSRIEKLVALSRRDLYSKIDERISDFARCNYSALDNWADEFRIQRRIPIPRAIVLLVFPVEQWVTPPKQDYVANILRFFEKRVVNSVMRGPLVRLTIAKTSSCIDMVELNSGLKPSSALLEHVLCRHGDEVQIDPEVLRRDPTKERRIWRMWQAANNNRRDTGIDTLYLGFPFLVIGDEKTRPRVAPVFLWPVKMAVSLGSGGKLTLGYDSGRAEIRLNPAIEGLVGQGNSKYWHQLHSNILGRDKITINDILDSVSTLAPVKERKLSSHPSTNIKVGSDEFYCHGSAVIFNAQFSGQAIAEDLRNLQGLPIKGSGLEHLLRVSEGYDIESIAQYEESNRYNVVPADPSQDKAILRGRNSPGIVIEGPPGTGKSQTIVNVIADCIGRNEKVLVVCQKQAALRVVEKRLEAVNLSHRLMTVTDVNKDRQSVIKSIRDQIPDVLASDPAKIEQARQKRFLTSSRIDQLERELNERHEVLNQLDPISSLTYKQVICQLIELDSDDRNKPIVQPTIRRLLSNKSPNEIQMVMAECSALASDWLLSNFEYSALKCFKTFNTDSDIDKAIKQNFLDFFECEQERVSAIKDSSSTHDNQDLDTLKKWGGIYLEQLSTLDDEQVLLAKRWFSLFYDEVNEESEGEDCLKILKGYLSELKALNSSYHDDRFFKVLLNVEQDELIKLNQYTEFLSGKPTFFSHLNPFRYFRRKNIKGFLKRIEESYLDSNLIALKNAIALEIELRVLRKKSSHVLGRLKINSPNKEDSTLKHMLRSITSIVKRAELMVKLCEVVRRCPLKEEAKAMLKSGDPTSLNNFSTLYQGTIRRLQARETSVNTLERISSWLNEQWLDNRKFDIEHNNDNLELLNDVLQEIDNLCNFQRFKLRSKDKDKLIFEVFKELRVFGNSLKSIPKTDLGRLVSRSMRREALLGWKLRIEENIPSLLIGKTEMEEKIASLAELDEQKTHLNQILLGIDWETQKIASHTKWNDITRLRGERYKKLREFIDLGIDLGLMEIRPVWMMSPDAVSQALPRVHGLFDVVIFDEASQMPVDFAVPSLYRSKRAIISGDEKQMPPSNFFSSSVDTDEEEIGEELDEDASEAEVAHQEEVWNRREIKDCPDLLVLGKATLPTNTLEIHYRSDYRALIDFSNYAYYSGKLHVPALHPEEVIIRKKPIEVHHVNGVYRDQTNADEANTVVQIITNIWNNTPETRPSLGVVTFNKKQCELIENTIQAYAEEDAEFYRAYLKEQDRQQNGEDMGFFVKNVENVQGDERDIIIFSTTFGLNEHGSFRRNFGVLGHKGGERRLNVAVTRARQKVIIATSMPIRDISDMLATGRLPTKPRDFIQAYLEYASKISAGEILNAKEKISRIAKSVSRPYTEDISDGFTSSVRQFISTLGYSADTGLNDDAFNVDLAIKDSSTGQYSLGIECDAPVASLLNNTRARDIWRPRVLEKSLPYVHRINCYDWYMDNDNEKQRLKEIIERAVGA
ncbi:AAA domain-containing protein [Teredinibacter turnerae]|uniref:AAA domain-containing protein n=1 Tax=Teredinibacter turnerae TaxID=2426 RepID=UPI000425757A|nr:AAA domain-containing protein [Teredinibacter turnerae]